MPISCQVLVITGTVIEFTFKITHSVQVFNITKPITDFLRFATVSSIIITHLDDIFRITKTITNTVIIWTTVLAIIVTDFVKVDQVTFAIVNQEVGLASRNRLPLGNFY